ncbi:MAG: UrcA family protein [Candidatus Andeanibacterium colombiense]|uniref:UrcA family protein n=1 Tax=Candidatus Andeanibacterium colombiense TaxID=3121345 RepID=A0AAJ5X3M6_9SPHN|nr:MAG: UrcA family protein [Sphingomonadaceae bacterium]
MRNLILPALAALTLAAGFAAPAAAAETVTVKVGYSDLDLQTEVGKETLQTRIAGAVKTACAKPDTRGLKVQQQWESCKDSASNSAAKQFEKTLEFAGI